MLERLYLQTFCMDCSRNVFGLLRGAGAPCVALGAGLALGMI